MNAADIVTFFERLKAENPNPNSELVYRNHFELLIAVMLSAQATDASVNKVTAKLFQYANTPEAFLALGETRLKNAIKSIGLFNTKAANILKTCRILVEKYGGEVPCSREDLESLAGVGRKTANVVLNTAFGAKVIAVDTHVFRVANRTGLAVGKTVAAVEAGLMKNVPDAYLLHAHHWLILHGRYTCRARNPLCQHCVVADLCAQLTLT
ncbi:endonuclease III [Dichelobacter nodosus]|uniref:Endonuclease III n=1 Tax=Dichelobacter nodosus (strain VCS1703A) TaxID=246195 RepID=A5EVJ5_DICNV|nr:endonuclease III [Dichelobacter nodosus]ABQ14319.1 endonuclease III [Dichelobacter nodosus VCS1703A]TGA66749.1 endonuclease III [Dichelobacter nodosus]